MIWCAAIKDNEENKNKLLIIIYYGNSILLYNWTDKLQVRRGIDRSKQNAALGS